MKMPWRSVVVGLVALTVTRPSAAPSTLDIFSSDEPLALQLKAPLDELFDNGRDTETYSVVGSISTGSHTGRSKPIENVKVSSAATPAGPSRNVRSQS